MLVTDPFEKHVTRTMDALKKSVERAGCTMDSIIHLEVFLCLPLADGIPMPTGKARFDAHKAQYDALNKIYGTYFSPGKAPSRACMALEWIPGDSLIEIVGSAASSSTPPTAGDDKETIDEFEIWLEPPFFSACAGRHSRWPVRPGGVGCGRHVWQETQTVYALCRRQRHRAHHQRAWLYRRHLRRAWRHAARQHQRHGHRHRRIGDEARGHGADARGQRALCLDRRARNRGR